MAAKEPQGERGEIEHNICSDKKSDKIFASVKNACYFRSDMDKIPKNNPVGIRFNKKKLDFVREKHPELKTPQQVVNFFLDNFWWRYHREDLPEEVKKQPMTPIEAYPAPDGDYDQTVKLPVKKTIKAQLVPASDGKEAIRAQIKALMEELMSPPKGLDTFEKAEWKNERKKAIETLRKQL
jgi:hypothetical protein